MNFKQKKRQDKSKFSTVSSPKAQNFLPSEPGMAEDILNLAGHMYINVILSQMYLSSQDLSLLCTLLFTKKELSEY